MKEGKIIFRMDFTESKMSCIRARSGTIRLTSTGVRPMPACQKTQGPQRHVEEPVACLKLVHKRRQMMKNSGALGKFSRFALTSVTRTSRAKNQSQNETLAPWRLYGAFSRGFHPRNQLGNGKICSVLTIKKWRQKFDFTRKGGNLENSSRPG